MALGVTPEQLRKAVQAVGPMVADVKRHLGNDPLLPRRRCSRKEPEPAAYRRAFLFAGTMFVRARTNSAIGVTAR